MREWPEGILCGQMSQGSLFWVNVDTVWFRDSSVIFLIVYVASIMDPSVLEVPSHYNRCKTRNIGPESVGSLWKCVWMLWRKKCVENG